MILLTGASGYVGGRLLRVLQSEGRAVRSLVRVADTLPGSVVGDVRDPKCLRSALQGCDAAVYLVHSMTMPGRFADEDRHAARTFAVAAREAGVRRIVYLGGLGSGERLSEHLASRQEVGRILRESGVPVLELRASIIIGAGSLSFELIRALVDKLPFMTTPRWVRTPAQPIAIDDVIAYLRAGLDAEPPLDGVFEIGGAERTSYGGLMREYARQEGLRRWIVPLPVLTPRLSALWLRLVAPIQAQVGAAMIDGVRNATVVSDDRALREFSTIRPVGAREAIRRARTESAPARPPDRSFPALLACLAACFAVAALGRLAFDAEWYATLRKPDWTPAPAVFGPVWTVLYTMMAVAAWLVWSRDGIREARLSLGCFALQLALNGAWSWLFFFIHAPGLALVDLVLLTLAAAATTVLFWARSTAAGLLMLPYLAWLLFAAALNLAIWTSSPNRLAESARAATQVGSLHERSLLRGCEWLR